MRRSIPIEAVRGEGAKAIPENTMEDVFDIPDNTPNPSKDHDRTIPGLGFKRKKRIGTLTAASAGRCRPDRDRLIHSPRGGHRGIRQKASCY